MIVEINDQAGRGKEKGKGRELWQRNASKAVGE